MLKNEILHLPPLWLARWQNPDPFWHALHLQGEIYRQQPGRKTVRFIEDGEPYFIKCHYGVGWKEIFKNIMQARLPILGAKNEYHALDRLSHSGFVTKIIGYGWRGNNPAHQESFLITKALNYTISLEDYCRTWQQHPPAPLLKRALIHKVAYIAKTMHEQGINHRDFYLCHFLLDMTGGRELLNPHQLTLYLIDLHRAQLRRKVPFRWRVKDIAGLYFSAMEIGLTQRDLRRFMMAYNGGKNLLFWHAVQRRAIKLYRKITRKLTLQTAMPFFLTLKNYDFLQLLEILRYLPNKRLVVRGEWQGKIVLAKLFVKQYHALREMKNYTLLQKHKILTPKLLVHGWAQHKALYVLFFEYHAKAETFHIKFKQADFETKKQYLTKLLTLIHQQHQAGLWQQDLHFDNFLAEDEKIFTIDLAAIRSQEKPLTTQQRNANLAQLFAQLPRDLLHLADSYLTPDLQKALDKTRVKREEKYLAKVQRNCTAYHCKKSKNNTIIINRGFDNTEMQEFIGNLLTQKTLPTDFIVDNQSFHLGFFKSIRWRDYLCSPARRAWLSLHKELLAEQPCPIPVALIEKKWFFFTTSSYLITTI